MKTKEDMKTFKVIELNHRDISKKLWARLVVQVLFDEYRNNGGDLSRIDNLLCDYDIIREKFQKWESSYYKDVLVSDIVFWWTFGGDLTDIYEYKPDEAAVKVVFNCVEFRVEFYQEKDERRKNMKQT